MGKILQNCMGTQKSQLQEMPSKEDRFYICHKCDFIGWRESAQGSCCMSPDQIYVVDWIFEKGREVMIKPESK